MKTEESPKSDVLSDFRIISAKLVRLAAKFSLDSEQVRRVGLDAIACSDSLKRASATGQTGVLTLVSLAVLALDQARSFNDTLVHQNCEMLEELTRLKAAPYQGDLDFSGYEGSREVREGL